MARLIAELKNVSFHYNGIVVLDKANLEIFDKDFIGIIGPNGGGKTTMIKLLLRLLKPANGSVIYHKPDLSIGYLPQYTNIDKHFPMQVIDIVLSGLLQRKGLFKRFAKADYKLGYSALERIGIRPLGSSHIGSLSGGQTQKVLLARAIVSNPDLLVLDEPETYVDYVSEGELYDLLKQLNQYMAILVVSHDLGLISSHIKTIACVNKQLHYHKASTISAEQLAVYNCPVQLITHGNVPHTVLEKHKKE